MANLESDAWSQHIRHTLKRYDEALLRQVAHKLCKPRSQWPIDELLDRITAALANPPMIDRRLKELPAACRQLLCAIAHSRQTRWPVGTLVELLVSFGAKDGLEPLIALLESGLLLPELFPFSSDPEHAKTPRAKVKNFSAWLARSEPMPIALAAPAVTKRALGADLGITCPEATAKGGPIHEADGLDWPLRLAVLWQHLLDAPLRRTQQGEFFKRDFDRLKSDPLLSAAPNDVLTPLPDPGFLAASLSVESGLARHADAELHAGDWPTAWKGALPLVLADLWAALTRVRNWNPVTGYAPTDTPGNPYASAYLLAMLLLTRLSDKSWAEPQAIEDWIAAHHPYWLGKKREPIGIVTFLLGLAYSLRLVQTTKSENDAWVIRLSPLGRWVMACSDEPPVLPTFQQTLLVQPNLEVLAYRQGLTPELVAGMSKIATWKTLGPACTLQLEPHSVYRALEMGESLRSLTHLLEAHGMKAIPTAVLDSLKTWSSKRERITIYSAGAIFEFGSAAEMNEAISRGLPAVRLTDRLAIVADENKIEYKHFRLTGTRDYTLPPECCVDVDADGVTLSVDIARSDLLLETELERFAEPISAIPSADGRANAASRSYRLTPASVAAARERGVTLSYLEMWFAQRTGLPIPAAAHLLMTAPTAAPMELRRQLVIHVANEHLADGLAQWPATRSLIRTRLGPKTLVIDEKDVPILTEHLKAIGVKILFEA